MMEKLHMLLTPNKDYNMVFPNFPVRGFWNCTCHKDYLIRATLTKLSGSG